MRVAIYETFLFKIFVNVIVLLGLFYAIGYCIFVPGVHGKHILELLPLSVAIAIAEGWLFGYLDQLSMKNKGIYYKKPRLLDRATNGYYSKYHQWEEIRVLIGSTPLFFGIAWTIQLFL